MTRSTGGTKVAARSVGEPAFANKVTVIVENVGKSLAAFALGTDPSTVGRWANGKNLPRGLDMDRRIENFYKILVFLLDDGTGNPPRSRHEARSWLMGINPHLDDTSPAEHIREGKYAPVMAAARAYAAGG